MRVGALKYSHRKRLRVRKTCLQLWQLLRRPTPAQRGLQPRQQLHGAHGRARLMCGVVPVLARGARRRWVGHRLLKSELAPQHLVLLLGGLELLDLRVVGGGWRVAGGGWWVAGGGWWVVGGWASTPTFPYTTVDHGGGSSACFRLIAPSLSSPSLPFLPSPYYLYYGFAGEGRPQLLSSSPPLLFSSSPPRLIRAQSVALRGGAGLVGRR